MDRRQSSALQDAPIASPRPGSVRRFRLSKGLDLPITGLPKQQIDTSIQTSRVALVGPDYHGMRPTMQVEVGQRVRAGETIFSDKKTAGVFYTAPGSGTVTAINRGEKRAFLSLEIELDGDAEETFANWTVGQIQDAERAAVIDQLVRSGFWTSLRTRPFSKVPAPDTVPHSIFVTAMDTNPLAADPAIVLAGHPDAFEAGLAILLRLGGEHVYLCKAAGTELPCNIWEGIETAEFAGPHPAGLPGTHIHLLAPAGRGRTVWYINYQDVVAIGRLFLTGRPDFERVISLAGPGVVDPRLVRTRIGANLTDLTAGHLAPETNRIVSGSVLCGRKSEQPIDYLGRYDLQVSVLPEVKDRELFGWISPGFNKFSLLHVVASKLIPGKRFALNTAMHGGHRAIVPMDMYEKVMPLDILPTFLFKALAVADLDQAEALGCLELDEEDLALCTFVDPGKGDFGALLRENLTVLEKEG